MPRRQFGPLRAADDDDGGALFPCATMRNVSPRCRSMSQRVSLFVTCLVDQLFPEVGLAMAEVLERLGYETEFREEQTCCGQPAFNSGFVAEARGVARHFLNVFDGAEVIVVPSGSCCSMIRHHFAGLFHKDASSKQATENLAARVYGFRSSWSKSPA